MKCIVIYRKNNMYILLDLDLIGNLTDLFAGGSETTSTSFRWMILLLAKHPEEQRKAQNLIDEVVPKDRQPTLEDRQQ